MRKKLWIMAIVVLVVAGSAVGWMQWKKSKVETAASQAGVSRTMTVSRSTLEQKVLASGVVVPEDDAQLFFGRAGRVKEVFVSEGRRVAKGTLLATLEAQEEELNLLTAQRQYDAALIESPPSVIKEREMTLQIIKEQLERTKLAAPFGGVVVELAAGVGEWVATSGHVLTLIDDSKLYINATIDEVDIAKIRSDQEAVVTFTALPGLEVKGRVKEVAMIPKNQSDLILFPVKIELIDPPSGVLIGLSAEVNIITARRENVLAVPLEAVLQNRGQSLVSVVGSEGFVEAVEVSTGLSDGRRVEITTGLAEGDTILANNFELYRELTGPAQHGPNIRVGLPGMRR